MPPTERLLRTTRLDLVAATLELVSAERRGPGELGPLPGATIPPTWPPGEYDRDALEFFHARLAEGGDSVVGWYGWYCMRRTAAGHRDALVAAAGYLGPPTDGAVEIGYSILPEARGRGYASEIVVALIGHAFEDRSVDHVFAHTTDDNVGSTTVLLKCGFERAGSGGDAGSVQYRRRRASSR